MVTKVWLKDGEMTGFIKALIAFFYSNILPIAVFCFAVIASMLIASSV